MLKGNKILMFGIIQTYEKGRLFKGDQESWNQEDQEDKKGLSSHNK